MVLRPSWGGVKDYVDSKIPDLTPIVGCVDLTKEAGMDDDAWRDKWNSKIAQFKTKWYALGGTPNNIQFDAVVGYGTDDSGDVNVPLVCHLTANSYDNYLMVEDYSGTCFDWYNNVTYTVYFSYSDGSVPPTITKVTSNIATAADIEAIFS